MELENICKIENPTFTINKDEFTKISMILKDALLKFDENLLTSRESMTKFVSKIGRFYKIIPSMSKLLSVYRSLISSNEIVYNKKFEELFRTRLIRSQSGVIVITVFTSPYPETSSEIQRFSCSNNCHYCPKEPNQPRSYQIGEPAVARANHCHFIASEQFYERGVSYITMGHPLDKIELIVSGGTFTSYPREYIATFFRDLFYAANVIYDRIVGKTIRQPLSLYDEQMINQKYSTVKIIGITIETRPDKINYDELRFLRSLGVTRAQIGVQHIDDRVLKQINRGCTNNDTIHAIKLLKETGFKVDIHLMPDLPPPIGLTPAQMVKLDKWMFDQVIDRPEYQADQWKIYPCQTIPYTEIKKWFDNGSYKPYANLPGNLLFDLLMYVKKNVKPWVRLNRIVRDIPTSCVTGGVNNAAMRNDLLVEMAKNGLKCNCIRCREVKNKHINIQDFNINIRKYNASEGIEYFISWENKEGVLLGFLRLRINKNKYNVCFPELSGCSLIRELHIYGQVINHDSENVGNGVQHMGLGKGLITKAIDITKKHGLNKIAVISGVGVRDYYIKQNFIQSDTFKDIDGLIKPALGGYLIHHIEKQRKSQFLLILKIIIVFLFLVYFLKFIIKK